MEEWERKKRKKEAFEQDRVLPSFILLAIDKCVIARRERSPDQKISFRAKVGRVKGKNERNATFVSDLCGKITSNCKSIVSKLLR